MLRSHRRLTPDSRSQKPEPKTCPDSWPAPPAFQPSSRTTHRTDRVTVTCLDPVTPAHVHAASWGPTGVRAYLHGLHLV